MSWDLRRMPFGVKSIRMSMASANSPRRKDARSRFSIDFSTEPSSCCGVTSVTLENLVGIGRLKPHKAAPEEISRLLTSAAASLADAKRKENSLNSRLDLAYKAIMQSALAALMANGYRPSTNEAGHQQ